MREFASGSGFAGKWMKVILRVKREKKYAKDFRSSMPRMAPGVQTDRYLDRERDGQTLVTRQHIERWRTFESDALIAGDGMSCIQQHPEGGQ